MKKESYLKYILSDNKSLDAYFRCHRSVTLQDIKRSILLKVRERGYAVADHYYRLGVEHSFEGIEFISEIFTKGLVGLSENYLETRDGKVYVIGRYFNDWQMILPEIPPLLPITLLIWKKYGPITGPLVDYTYKNISSSIKYTALIAPYIPEMKVCVEENGGFSDLHIHLNGALETDHTWNDFLRYPEQIYLKLRDAFKDEKNKEQIYQETSINDPIEFLKLFQIAGRLREWLFRQVTEQENIYKDGSFGEFLDLLDKDSNSYPNHPLCLIFGMEASPLIMEGTLYILIFDYLAKYGDRASVANAFHYYLLIKGVCNRLLVQQSVTFGFEQFQKYTTNNFRDHSETQYLRRFLQFAGNNLNQLRHIEGRFSPKDTLDKNIDLIGRIRKGFMQLEQHSRNVHDFPVTMSLIAHFIKKEDKKRDRIRFRLLREELERKTTAIIALRNSGSKDGQLVKGIDAAASEFDTPPEVFAPYYKRLRKAGFEKFTFHAGEDYFHILSGLRAIDEAIIYLDLRDGDRIGHATASGVDVALWHQNVGDAIWMRMEDYMFDLVFAYILISNNPECELVRLLPLIALRAEEYASQIYSSAYSIHEIISAWKIRSKDPLISEKEESFTGISMDIFRQYHSKEGQKKGRKIISVKTYDIFKEKDLVALQLLLLKDMHNRQIIIETLPTSNVIIGQHHDFSTYHLYNWLKWSKEGHEVPAIIVGTDDTGIFATNIFNEYCHIYCLLVFDKGLSAQEAMEFIRTLIHNSKVYAF